VERPTPSSLPSSTSPDCTDDRVYVYQERGKGILWLSVDGKLKEVSVTITRDDAPVTDQTFSPKYEDTELNGPGVSYNVWTLANGDKFFVRTQIVSHNASWADASRKGAENKTAGPITGGTGKLAGLRGMTRNASTFDPKTGSNTSRFDLEYWIEGR